MEIIKNIYAITKRELASYFLSPIAIVFLIVFLLLINFFTFAPFLGSFYELGISDLRSFFIWHPWIYLVLVPAVAMRLWAEERRVKTIELLLTLPITTTQALLGKFIAAGIFLTIALILTFPVIITAEYLGSPDYGTVVGGYLGSWLMALTYLATGMVCSSLTKNQVISFVIAVIVCLFMALAGFQPVTELMIKWAPQWLVNLIAGIGIIPHYISMQRGVIDMRDVVYFLTLIPLLLFLCHIIVESKKSA